MKLSYSEFVGLSTFNHRNFVLEQVIILHNTSGNFSSDQLSFSKIMDDSSDISTNIFFSSVICIFNVVWSWCENVFVTAQWSFNPNGNKMSKVTLDDQPGHPVKCSDLPVLE